MYLWLAGQYHRWCGALHVIGERSHRATEGLCCRNATTGAAERQHSQEVRKIFPWRLSLTFCCLCYLCCDSVTAYCPFFLFRLEMYKDQLKGVHMVYTGSMKRRRSTRGSSGAYEDVGRTYNDAMAWIAQQKVCTRKTLQYICKPYSNLKVNSNLNPHTALWFSEGCSVVSFFSLLKRA